LDEFKEKGRRWNVKGETAEHCVASRFTV
jgi:hypothetical protein